MDIYSTKAEFVGRVEDVILNLDKGEVMRLSFRPFKGANLTGEDVKKIIQDESVSYDDVAEVGDVILVNNPPPARASRSG